MYVANFKDNDGRNIEVVYCFKDNGELVGEAYFTGQDVLADLNRDGTFTHPMFGTRYRLHAPSRHELARGRGAILDVQRWATAGTSTVTIND